jgi:predicted nuclease of predicted toxin-antitoxin system
VKLLFDQNISFKLVELLSDIFPKSKHVRDLDLAESTDQEIWNYAKDNEYVIVSKDSDFHQLSFLYGPPPKAIYLSLGNCTTAEIEQSLRAHTKQILEFLADEESAFLVLYEAEA